jgi:hypothetical protein
MKTTTRKFIGIFGLACGGYFMGLSYGSNVPITHLFIGVGLFSVGLTFIDKLDCSKDEITKLIRKH